ncbi:MAG: AarF/UbiB family protein [Xenococcaceae cyanobacterium MO_234.B1]|nr:AarF/UbiB family protein [Xenococcaceae cyanobacterium MO_234.B1]
MRQELSQPITQVFNPIEPQPIAAGSIAQIHRATLVTGEAVALKVQRPGIDRIVDKDIKLIKAIAQIFERSQKTR